MKEREHAISQHVKAYEKIAQMFLDVIERANLLYDDSEAAQRVINIYNLSIKCHEIASELEEQALELRKQLEDNKDFFHMMAEIKKLGD